MVWSRRKYSARSSLKRWTRGSIRFASRAASAVLAESRTAESASGSLRTAYITRVPSGISGSSRLMSLSPSVRSTGLDRVSTTPTMRNGWIPSVYRSRPTALAEPNR